MKTCESVNLKCWNQASDLDAEEVAEVLKPTSAYAGLR